MNEEEISQFREKVFKLYRLTPVTYTNTGFRRIAFHEPLTNEKYNWLQTWFEIESRITTTSGDFRDSILMKIKKEYKEDIHRSINASNITIKGNNNTVGQNEAKITSKPDGLLSKIIVWIKNLFFG